MKNQIEIQLSELLYYIFLVLMFLLKGFGLYDGQLIYKLVFMAAMLCIVFKLALSEYTVKEWLIIIITGILAVIINRCSGEKGVLICYAVIVGMRGILLKRVMQIGAAIYGVSMLIMVTYYGVFLDQSVCLEGIRMGVAAVPRYGMGYPHPNTFHVTYLVVCALIIYCIGEKLNWKHVLLLMAGNVYTFIYSMSYTATFTTAMLILLAWYVVKRKELSKAEYGITALAFPAVFFVSVLAPFVLPGNIKEILKSNLYTVYHRIELAEQYVTKENVSLFGKQAAEVITGSYSVDNSFLYCLLFGGVLFFAVMMLLYIYLMYRLIKEKRNIELVITCVFLVEAIMEPYLFNTSFKNITLFFVGSVLWKNKDCLTKKIRILKDREICLNCTGWSLYSSKIQECWCINKKNVLGAGCAAGVIALVIFVAAKPLDSNDLITVMAYLRSLCSVVWITVWLVGVCMMLIRFVKSLRKV